MFMRRQNRRKTTERRWQLPELPWRRLLMLVLFVGVTAAAGYGLILALDRPISVVGVEGRFQRISPIQVEQAVTQALREQNAPAAKAVEDSQPVTPAAPEKTAAANKQGKRKTGKKGQDAAEQAIDPAAESTRQPLQAAGKDSQVKPAGFLTVDLENVQRSVEALPWVDHARVQRRWPHGLRVQITEQVAAACWGENGLLNTRGELFVRDARHVPPELPRLNGPPGSEWQVAQRYLSAQGRLIEVGTRLMALELDARGAWDLKLANGIAVRLGRREVDQRLDRLIRTALPLLSGRSAEINYIDMRYSNGFAVGWKDNHG